MSVRALRLHKEWINIHLLIIYIDYTNHPKKRDTPKWYIFHKNKTRILFTYHPTYFFFSCDHKNKKKSQVISDEKTFLFFLYQWYMTFSHKPLSVMEHAERIGLTWRILSDFGLPKSVNIRQYYTFRVFHDSAPKKEQSVRYFPKKWSWSSFHNIVGFDRFDNFYWL